MMAFAANLQTALSRDDKRILMFKGFTLLKSVLFGLTSLLKKEKIPSRDMLSIVPASTG